MSEPTKVYKKVTRKWSEVQEERFAQMADRVIQEAHEASTSDLATAESRLKALRDELANTFKEIRHGALDDSTVVWARSFDVKYTRLVPGDSGRIDERSIRLSTRQRLIHPELAVEVCLQHQQTKSFEMPLQPRPHRIRVIVYELPDESGEES